MISEATIVHYANHRSIRGFLAQPESAEEILKQLEVAGQRGQKVSSMGSQNSFSDIFMTEGQLHLSMLKMNRVIDFDRDNAEITVESGVRICDVLQYIMPSGYYLTGLSGSYTDTIGGMLSSNSHGKDSWKYGNFGNNVLQLKLMKADGSITIVHESDELMKAVLAGLGLLGIIIEVKLKLKRLPSATLITSERKMDIKDLADFDDDISEYKFTWIDMCSADPYSIVRTASFDLLHSHEKIEGVNFPKIETSIWGLPPKRFWKLIALFWNPVTYNTFNNLLRATHRDKKTKQRTIIDYLYPWRKYPDNKYLFNHNSFYELQVLFPREKFLTAFGEIRALFKAFQIFPLSSAVKWHHTDDIFLSFSGNGLSITNTFDSRLASRVKGKDFLDKYTSLALGLGGKFYLSKYPYLDREQVKYSFPGFDQWLKLKRENDPENIFVSDTAAAWILA